MTPSTTNGSADHGAHEAQTGAISTSSAKSDSTSMLDPSRFPQSVRDSSSTVVVSLTYDPLSVTDASAFLKSPSAGANVLFTGTTRNSFNSRRVSRLSYSAYPALALRTLLSVCQKVQEKHGLQKIYVIHRLGEVKVEEESIIVGVSSAHRGEGWRGAEELLELVKERAEIWKMEWFDDGAVEEGKDGEQGTEIGVWRANKDTTAEGGRRNVENILGS